jgi:hypothetical protein
MATCGFHCFTILFKSFDILTPRFRPTPATSPRSFPTLATSMAPTIFMPCFLANTLVTPRPMTPIPNCNTRISFFISSSGKIHVLNAPFGAAVILPFKLPELNLEREHSPFLSQASLRVQSLLDAGFRKRLPFDNKFPSPCQENWKCGTGACFIAKPRAP